jgi:hypothetical protein
MGIQWMVHQLPITNVMKKYSSPGTFQKKVIYKVTPEAMGFTGIKRSV